MHKREEFINKNLRRFIAAVLSVLLLGGTFSGMAVPVKASEADEHKLFFASDYQGSAAPDNLEAITKNIKEAGIEPELAVWCGDYIAGAGWVDPTGENTAAEMKESYNNILTVMTGRWPLLEYMFLQGNHDSTALVNNGTLTPTGAKEYDDYIVYIINKDDFPWAQGVDNDFTSSSKSKATVEKTASNLNNYLEGLIENDCTKPVIIATHVPLAWSARTSDWSAGWLDNIYAGILFDVINEAAEKLDVLYLFGHNHSGQYDQYLGGSVNYLHEGDVMKVPDGTEGHQNYTSQVINFTYLNAGYMGYTNKGLDPDISTATIMTIDEETIKIEKYSPDGLYAPATQEIQRQEPRTPNSLIVSETNDTEERKVGESDKLTFAKGNVEPLTYNWILDDTVEVLSATNQSTIELSYEKAGETKVKCEITYENENGTTEKLEREYVVSVLPEINKENLEKSATIEVSNCAAGADPNALNDGLISDTSLGKNVPHWNTVVSQDNSVQWATYKWQEPVYVDTAEIFYYVNSENGVELPASCSFEYLNENEEWVPLENTGKTAIQADTYNAATFEGIYTKGLKVLLKKKNDSLNKGIGMLEWKVSGNDSDVEVLADFNFDDEEDGLKGGLAVATGTYQLDNGTLYLDGSKNNWLNITKGDGSSLLTGQEEITVSMDVKRNRTKTNWAFYAAPHPYDQTVESEHYIGVLINEGLTAERYNSWDMTRPSQAAVREVSDDWMHLDIVYRKNATDVYINGRLATHKQTDVAIDEMLGENSVLWIGKAPWGSSEFFDGWLDNYKIVARAMTSEEIAQQQGLKPVLEAEFDFDDSPSGFESEGAVVSGTYNLTDHEDGKALSLNGSGQYLKIAGAAGNSILSGCDEFSVSFQVKPDTSSSTNWIFYAAPNNDTQEYSKERYIGIFGDANNKIRVERYNNNGSRPSHMTYQISDEWTYITLVFAKEESIFYVNGEEVARDPSTYAITDILGNNSIINIGKANWKTGEYYKGEIDNISIMGYAMTPEQVKELINGEKEPAILRPEIPVGMKLPYEDVSKDAWYYDNVYYNYFAGTMKGVKDTLFAPGENLARAQFAIILYRMNGEPQVTYNDRFPDVLESDWYAQAVLWAASTEVVKGYENTGMFGPSDYINREQMAVMMYRYAKYRGYDISVKADYDKFTDASDVNEFAEEAMSWAVGNKIITGKDNGTRLDPQGKATRAECAAIIQRFIEQYGL